MSVSLRKDRAADLAGAFEVDGGFTYDPRTDELISIGDVDGYAVALPGTEIIVGSERVGVIADLLAGALVTLADEMTDGEIHIGGWFSADRGEFVVELSEVHVVGREQALSMAAARGQESVLDLGSGEFLDVVTITLGGLALREAAYATGPFSVLAA